MNGLLKTLIKPDWDDNPKRSEILDKKIVLNSMILKWDNVKKEFPTLINF